VDQLDHLLHLLEAGQDLDARFGTIGWVLLREVVTCGTTPFSGRPLTIPHM